MSALELKIPPVAVVLAFSLAMWLVGVQLPSLVVGLPLRTALVAVLAASGTAFALAGVAAFRKARTTVNPLHPGSASAIVMSGVYRLSRNPMYVGLLLALAAWAVYLSHPVAFIFLPLFIAYMNRFQIVPEERALSSKFGSEFAAYRRSVRRWL